MSRNSFDENKVVTMLISKMMIFHYLNSMCQSYHFEYPLASYEKRMPQLPIIKDITDFLDNVILHRPHHDSLTKKRDSSGPERSFFQLLNKILLQPLKFSVGFENRWTILLEHKVTFLKYLRSVFQISSEAIYENCTNICDILIINFHNFYLFHCNQ